MERAARAATVRERMVVNCIVMKGEASDAEGEKDVVIDSNHGQLVTFIPSEDTQLHAL